jgi:colicin import membrane protein
MTDDATPYSIPKEPGRWRAFALAALVHGALVGLLWFSVRWQNETPVAIEAEVWSPEIRAAAPVAPPPPPPEPEPEVRPAPQPKVVEAPPPPPKPVVVEPPVVNPEIALAQEKKRKEKLQKERQEREQRERLEKQKAEREEARLEKLAAAKEAAKLEKQKQLADAKRIEKEKADALDKKRIADAQKKSADDARLKRENADQAQRDKARNEDLQRMMAQAGSGGSGSAPKSQGPQGDVGYGSKVAAKIRSNTVFNVPANLAGNPAVEYAVNLLPDGSLRRPIRKIRSSGVPGFDEAVLNAIERSEPFPADKTGKVPDSVNIIHKPKD